jgi:hypothetical protein
MASLIVIALLMVTGFAACTTEKHYPAPAPTVIHESNSPSPSDAREGARQGAREGVRDQTRP